MAVPCSALSALVICVSSGAEVRVGAPARPAGPFNGDGASQKGICSNLKARRAMAAMAVKLAALLLPRLRDQVEALGATTRSANQLLPPGYIPMSEGSR